MLTAFARDARYALRMFRKTPGVTSIAILALALGIGANTAIFTLVKAVLLSPLPYPQPERLALLMRAYRANTVPTISALKLDTWRHETHTFEAITGFDFMGSGFNLVTAGGDAERILGLRVAGDFFKAVGVSPALGRGFSAEETLAGGPHVTVISHGLWQRRFGGDPGLIGRHITMSGLSYEVIGVMPRQFRFAPEAELWVPLHAPIVPDDTANFMLCLGRLRPGISIEQARADMASAAQTVRRTYGKVMADDESIAVLPAGDTVASFIRPALLMLFGAVAFVLLIACANIANLLLARAAARTREVALRVAMGAGRWTLVRQMLIESTMLSLAGGVVGLLLGAWGTAVLVSFIPGGVPLFDFRPDGRVVIFTVVIALGTGLLFGLAPAFHAWRTDLNNSLKESARAGENRGRGLFRRVLVVAEIALAVVLVVGAGLLLESIVRLQQVRAGFDPHNLLTMQMSMVGPRYADPAAVDAFYRRGITRLEALPGVEAVATVTSLPLERGPDFTFEIGGRGDSAGMPSAQWRSVTPQYFRAMRIPVLRGRAFSETDNANAAPVIIVNDAFARRCWPGKDPIGEQIIIGRKIGLTDAARVVVGVIADIKEMGLDTTSPEMMYVPTAQVPASISTVINRLMPVNWIVRTAVAPISVAEEIKRELRIVDPQQPVSNIRTMEQVVGQSMLVRNLSTSMLAIFAGVALLLAAIGVYGVMSYSVTQRTHEMGVRLALGATRGGILRLVLGQAGVLALIGIGLGLLAATGVTRMLSTLLYQVSTTNLVTFAAVAVVLLGVALVASFIPARRAMRVDPMIALRYE